MKVTLRSTTKLVTLKAKFGGELPARIWERLDQRMCQYFTEIQNDDKDMHRWQDYAVALTGSPCASGAIEDAGWPLPNVQLTERGRKIPYELFPADLKIREYPEVPI